jgi:MFS superfamily sulfate permease-like transporter
MVAGARTQIANLVAALLCFLTLVLLTPLFRDMPHPTLAAIVIAAMLHLSKPAYLRKLFGRSRWEISIAVIVVASELTLGVLQGIALGVVVSLLLVIYRASHPHGAVLGQVPGTEAYRNVERHPEALTFPGLLIWRPGGDLWFASIDHLGDGLQAALAATHPPPKHVLMDAEAVNQIDVSACDALLNLFKELQKQGISFAIARVRDHLREGLRLGGVEAIVGPTNFHERVTDGVRAWQRQTEQEARGPDGASTGPRGGAWAI